MHTKIRSLYLHFISKVLNAQYSICSSFIRWSTGWPAAKLAAGHPLLQIIVYCLVFGLLFLPPITHQLLFFSTLPCPCRPISPLLLWIITYWCKIFSTEILSVKSHPIGVCRATVVNIWQFISFFFFPLDIRSTQAFSILSSELLSPTAYPWKISLCPRS